MPSLLATSSVLSVEASSTSIILSTASFGIRLQVFSSVLAQLYARITHTAFFPSFRIALDTIARHIVWFPDESRHSCRRRGYKIASAYSCYKQASTARLRQAGYLLRYRKTCRCRHLKNNGCNGASSY